MPTQPQPSPFITRHQPTCPTWLLDGARGKGEDFRIAIAGGDSLVAVETAALMLAEKLATPHIIGSPSAIQQHADALGLDSTGLAITPAASEDEVMEAAAALVQAGEVGGLLKGHIHTDRFMSGILRREHGIRGDGRMLHIFAMFTGEADKPLLISDGAVNVAPDVKTSQAQLLGLAEVARSLGIKVPRIAIISATETPIASVPSSLAAKELADWGKVNLPHAHISGPLSFDLAVSPEAAAIKGIGDDKVAGYADCLLMPDLVSGNVLFKAMVWFKAACAAGVVVGGKVPIMLTSRADAAAARLASIAVAAHLR